MYISGGGAQGLAQVYKMQYRIAVFKEQDLVCTRYTHTLCHSMNYGSLEARRS